jgi:hypothetical protein
VPPMLAVQVHGRYNDQSKKHIEVRYENCNEALMTLTISNNKARPLSLV